MVDTSVAVALCTLDHVGRLLEANFPYTRHLSAVSAAGLVATLAAEGIGGGSVYDALVAAAALEQDVPLVTRDTSALPTYRAVGAALTLAI